MLFFLGIFVVLFTGWMQERECVIMEGEEEELPGSCCCFAPVDISSVKIRDPSMLPSTATLLITKMTEKQPEDRMTVREAQNHAYIVGEPGETPYLPPQGDYCILLYMKIPLFL